MSQAVSQQSVSVAEQMDICWQQYKARRSVDDIIVNPSFSSRSTRRAAHHPTSKPARRFLTKNESNLLKNGKIPSVKRSEVKLSRRQKSWWDDILHKEAEAKLQRVAGA